jgi:hypothetical protein
LSKATLDTEIRRTMEQTRKAIRDAVRHASTAEQSSSDDDQNLDSLAHDGVDVDRDATVIVRNRHNSNRTIVQTDDSGTYVIEAGAKTHLTARNKHGNVLFDGDIDTPAQRDHVPKEVWERAEPMYDQIATSGSTLPKSNDNKSGE